MVWNQSAMRSYGVKSAEKKGGLENGFGGKNVPSSGTPVDFEKAIALTGYGKFNYLLLLAAFPSAMVSVFDTTTMAYILPAAQCDLQLTSVAKGALNAITYAGMISSSLLWGGLSDRLGRYRLLVAGYLLDFACGAASAFAREFWVMIVLRYLVGFLICGPYAILMSYLAEFHGAQYRSRIIMFTGVAVSVANFTLPALAWALVPMQWEYSLLDGAFVFKPWHAFVLLTSSVALVSGLVLLPFGESPKFLMSRGLRAEALAQFQRIYAANTGNPPSMYPVSELVNEVVEKPVEQGEGGPVAAVGAALRQMQPLVRMPLLPKAILVFAIQTGGLFGMNTLRLWVPQLFATMEEALAVTGGREAQAAGSLCELLDAANVSLAVQGAAEDPEACTTFVVEDRIYINSIIVGCVSAVCYFSAGNIVNWLGKRKLMIYSYAIAAAAGFAVFWAPNTDVVLALLAIYLAFCGICSTAILGVVVDVFPTALRTTMVALCMMFGRMGSLTGNVIFPILLEASCPAPFFMLPAAILACSVSSFLLPVTRGKHLE